MDIAAIIEYLKTNPSTFAELAKELEAKSKKTEIAQIKADIACYKQDIQKMNLTIGRTKQKVNMLERRLQKLTSESAPSVQDKYVGAIYFCIDPNVVDSIANILSQKTGDKAATCKFTNTDLMFVDGYVFNSMIWLTQKTLDFVLKEIETWPDSIGVCLIKNFMTGEVKRYVPASAMKN